MALSIRIKLVLLAGIPVLGALFLAQRVFSSAQEQARKADALGSVESLAVLSSSMTQVMKDLQRERAAIALATGRRDPQQMAVDAKARDESRMAKAFERTDGDLAVLDEFLSKRSMSRLPPRLARGLSEVHERLQARSIMRARIAQSPPSLLELLDWYEPATRAIVKSTAALTELSDDGQFLRLLSSFTALLELDERRSEQHALLAHVFAYGEFPPGSYRRLVTLVSEEHTFLDMFKTTASVELQTARDQLAEQQPTRDADQMRKLALESTDDVLAGDPDSWFDVRELEFVSVDRMESSVDAELRATTVAKLERSRRDVTVSVASAASVVLLSLFIAAVLAHDLTKRIERLRSASDRLARGDLSVRVPVGVRDELGEAGEAFNVMAEEIERTRVALASQARMMRDLEIASRIQRSMLPPRPSHSELEFASRLEPAEEVGGDFYDVLSHPTSGALWVTMGDVSGHGVGAGLVMLMTQIAFAAHFRQNPTAPSDVVFRSVNELLWDTLQNRMGDDNYVSAQLMVHEGGGQFSCIGGHTFPIVFRAKTQTCEVVKVVGPWLGCLPNLDELPTTSIALEEGDVLCLYTDGLLEARDPSGDQFGEERLTRLLASSLKEWPLREVVDAVFSTVDVFSGSGKREDDWAILLVKRGPKGASAAAATA